MPKHSALWSTKSPSNRRSKYFTAWRSELAAISFLSGSFSGRGDRTPWQVDLEATS